jgi:hypothetical protein
LWWIKSWVRAPRPFQAGSACRTSLLSKVSWVSFSGSMTSQSGAGQRVHQLPDRIGIAARHHRARRWLAGRKFRRQPRLQQRAFAGARVAGQVEERLARSLQPAQRSWCTLSGRSKAA